MPHYWLLYRVGKKYPFPVVGEAMIPFDYVLTDYTSNKQILETRLQETDVFDVDLQIRERDKLEIVMHNLSDYHARTIYTFRFEHGRWVSVSYDSFERLHHPIEDLHFGKIC
ncbi:hypothetical protein U0R10_02095 [Aquirufa sp. OSTEICH-129V]|uniref:DUF4288 domain-containing protein n=1 Tax=Aquirufa avitistagni TaxID=3104728 RepID=A0ABW6D911_9BACT